MNNKLAEKLVDYLYDPLDTKHHFGVKFTKEGCTIDWQQLRKTIGRPSDWNESLGGQLTDFFKTILNKPALADIDQECCKDIRRECHCQWWQTLPEEEKRKLKEGFSYTNKSGTF